MADDWYYGINGQTLGPVTKSVLAQMLSGGQINRQTLVNRQGMPGWEEIGNVPELGDILSDAPPGFMPLDLIGTVWREHLGPVGTYKFKKNGVLVLSYFEAGYDFNQTKKGTWTQNGSSVIIDLDGKHYELQFTDSDNMKGTYCYPKTTIGNPNEGYETSFFRKKGLFG